MIFNPWKVPWNWIAFIEILLNFIVVSRSLMGVEIGRQAIKAAYICSFMMAEPLKLGLKENVCFYFENVLSSQ